MRNDYTLQTRVLLLGLLMTATGCATSSAPRGWLPSSEEAQRHTFGGWIEVADFLQASPHRGELIAIAPDSVYVLNDTGLTVISKARVSKARLFGYDSNHESLRLWTLAGSVSTLSHGFGLVLSLPVWILAGSKATSDQSRKPVLGYPAQSWEAMRAFARFPQGLPSELDREALSLRLHP